MTQAQEQPTTISGWIEYVGKTLYPKFNLDDPYRKDIYKQVYYAITQNELYRHPHIDPTKGALVFGDKGVGKSLLFKTLQRLMLDTPRQFMRVTCQECLSIWEENDYKTAMLLAAYGLGCPHDLFIDDIGFGQGEQMIYGTPKNPIAELIYARYELYQSQRIRTYLTSNLVPKYSRYATTEEERKAGKHTLRTMYGDLCVSRIKEMCNLIVWEGEDFREGGNHD